MSTHTSSCPQLLAILVFASASLFDSTWQINCSRLMPSGPRSGITLGILAPLGYQLNTMAINCSLVTGLHRRVSPGHLHWHRPQHPHRLQLPPHSCRSNTLSLRTRLDASTQTDQFCPAQPQDAPILADPHCSHHRRLHTTPAYRVLSWVRLLQRPFGSRGSLHRHMGMLVAPHFPNAVTSPLSTFQQHQQQLRSHFSPMYSA